MAITLDGTNGIVAPSVENADGAFRPLISGTAVTASGTVVDFTGIPSWAKKITVTISGLSTASTGIPIIQIGDAGGVENTGYEAGACFGTQAASHYYSSTVGFPLSTAGQLATWISSGSVTFTNISGNIWVGSGSMFLGGIAVVTAACAGSKTLSGTLDRIRLTTNTGTDTFDAGTINIMYE